MRSRHKISKKKFRKYMFSKIEYAFIFTFNEVNIFNIRELIK